MKAGARYESRETSHELKTARISRVLIGSLLAVVFGLLLVGCGGGQSFDEPPEIIYGVDVCSDCNMIISEENFASAYWTADGEARMFDDLGEMALYLNDNQEEVASVWVHDMNTAEWLAAGDAWIVINAGVNTPMGTGVASVANEDDARALAFDQDGAMVMTFDDMMSRLASGELMIMMGGGHGGGMNGMDDGQGDMDEMGDG